MAISQINQNSLNQNVAGNGPAFHAYQNATQNISNGTITKILLQAESFDTNNNFNNTASTVGGAPAYSFLPTVAGYYQVWMQVTMGGPNGTNNYLNGYIYKNGSAWNQSASTQPPNGNYASAYCSALIYCNGSTDYIEFYTVHDNFVTNPQTTIATNWTYATGFLARAA